MIRRSRVTTGFHRLSLFLAVPFLLGAVGTAVSIWFSTDGGYVPDTSATPPLTVSSRQVVSGPWDLYAKQDKNDQNTVQITVDTGPHRTFVIRFTRLLADKAKADTQLLNSIVDSIALFEKRRGSVLLASEQLEVSDIALVQEDESKRKFGWQNWTHLKRGFDWQRLAVAGGIAGFAIFIYALTRALGWVIDGFVSRPKD